MSDDGRCGLFVPRRRRQRVVEKVRFSVRHQTPVLHGTEVEVGQSDLICGPTVCVCVCVFDTQWWVQLSLLCDILRSDEFRRDRPDLLSGYEML